MVSVADRALDCLCSAKFFKLTADVFGNILQIFFSRNPKIEGTVTRPCCASRDR